LHFLERKTCFVALSPRLQRKFLFVTGKGGVGKTTVAAVVARALAAAGKRTLLCFTEASSGVLLVKANLDGTPREVLPGLYAAYLEPESALREYGSLMLRSKTAYRALFENRVAKSFFSAIPGLFQWAVLGKACYHATELVDGRARFDCVVFDAPATGHGLEMLRVPKLITEISAPGPLRRDAEAAWRMLRHPDETGILVVTLLEELPVQETLELERELTSLGLPKPTVVVNAVSQQVFSDADAARLEEVFQSPLGSEAHSVVETALERAGLEAQQRVQLARLSKSAGGPIVLPRVEAPASSADLQRLVAALIQ
jgi:anion-transporting  ArsA/GET3 family ATPase